MAKVIISAALTGAVATPSMSPYLPITPQQIANEAVRAYEAGAAVAHIHVRDPNTGKPSSNIELFREVITNVKSRCNIILCLTTGGALGMNLEERIRVVSTFKPELASFNFGTLNFNLSPLAERQGTFKYPWEKEYLEMTKDITLTNTFKTLEEYSKAFAENDTKPEIEIYDTGMINNLAYMVEKGHVSRPLYVQFVMGILGGIPATPKNLMFFYETTYEAIGECEWSVCAAGVYQIPICTMALTMGGNTRVGLEDSLYIRKGVLAKSNAEQVEKVARIALELGIEPATPDEARKILGLKGLDQVNF
jgi:uncharacterized protein (DUF849 family)